jgi:hypothetical protein
MLPVARATHDNPWLAVGDVFEAVVAHELTPAGGDFFASYVPNILRPSTSFAVAKVVDIGDGEGGGQKVFEGVELEGDIDPVHVPASDAGEELEAAELGVGDRIPEMWGELAGFDHSVEDGRKIIDLNLLGQAVFVD